MGPSSGAAAKKEIPMPIVIIVVLVAIVFFAFVFHPWWFIEAPDQANRASCANNLSQIGRAMQTYAAAHKQAWPDLFTEESDRWDNVGNTRTDHWDPIAGTGKPPKAEPGDNGEPVQSNTANFWFLVASMGLTPDIFVCPDADHEVDAAVEDYAAVRDFRGETFVSYSFQNLLGAGRLTSTSGRGATLAVVADANPLRRDFRTSGIGDKQREGPSASPAAEAGVTDEYLADKPQFVGDEDYIAAWNAETGGIAGAWELNSPNHEFEGQNVLYLDGHVEWKTHPYCGPNWDNIWLARKPEDGWEVEKEKIGTLRHFNDPASYDGHFILPADSTGDSFLVP